MTHEQSTMSKKGRTIAIGDIHGYSRALSAILTSIQPVQEDTIVILGDAVDRGPDTKDVLDQLIELKEHCFVVLILGNHEEMMLAAQQNSIERRSWLSFGGQQTIDSYRTSNGNANIPQKHIDFLQQARLIFETSSYFFIHANYQPHCPLDRQTDRMTRWTFLQDHIPEPHRSGKIAVVGHSEQECGEVLDLGYLKCIDTNCNGGKWLTALSVEDNIIWQVNCNGRTRNTIAN